MRTFDRRKNWAKRIILEWLKTEDLETLQAALEEAGDSLQDIIEEYEGWEECYPGKLKEIQEWKDNLESFGINRTHLEEWVKKCPINMEGE